MVPTARYLHLKCQELHEALMTAHETIEFEVEEKVRLRGAAPAVDASAQPVALLTDQLAAMSSKHQEALTAAASNAERARLAERSNRTVEGERSGGAQGFGPFQPAGDEPADLSARLQQQLDSSRR
jgi:hypothetical protein